jgi:hypothetical protein
MKKNTSRVVAAAITLVASLAASQASADTTYEFDSLSSFVLGEGIGHKLTGILRNTSTPITVPFTDSTGRLGRCTPVLLTMMEKPGRYFLTITTQPPTGANGEALKDCGLSLRS